MNNEKHELGQEFPEFIEKIHTLKTTDNHFKKLFDEYHLLTKEIHSLEAHNMPTSDERFESLKKQRLEKKDQLFHMLKNN